MKFYDIINADRDYDLTYFNDYRIAGSDKFGFVVIKFDESKIHDVTDLVFNSINKDTSIKYNMSKGCYYYGSDGYIYNYLDGKLTKTCRKGTYLFFAVLYLTITRNKKVLKTRIRTHRRSLLYNESAVIKKFSVIPYKAYEFYSREHNITFKYRLKRASEANKPLVIYMAGGSCIGYDNFKQMYECHVELYKHLKIYDCNIFIPQMPCAAIAFKPNSYDYIYAVRQLIDKVCDEVSADRNRIYLIGTSGGGWCTWEMIYNSPDYFACGIPVMGNFLVYRDKDEVDFERFLKTQMWVAHAEDDDNVLIDSDDYCVDKLKKIGSDVRYSRWEKYGHKMSSKFYKSEPWAEWMFRQVKK